MAAPGSTEQHGIFSGKLIDFRPKGSISHLVANNGEMLLATNARELLHIPLQNISRQIEVALPLSTHDRIAYVHMNVSGRHALVSSTGGENFYVSLKSNQPKALKRAKGLVVTAVGWNPTLSTDSETSFIALGTNKGNLYETSIQSHGNVLYLKELHQCLAGVKDLPITNVGLHQCDDRRWAMFVCYPGRLYCLTGILNKMDQSNVQPVVGTIWTSAFVEQFNPVLQPLFSFKDTLRFHCMDDAQRALPSAFAVHPMALNGDPPRNYCWLGADGFTMGKIDLASTDGYNIINEEAHVQNRLVNGRYDYPLDIAVTSYHVLLLYSDRLEAVSLLNQKSTYEEPIGVHSGQLKGMCRDPITEVVWVYTDSGVLRFQPDEETRNVWRIYLERGDFRKARELTCRLKDQAPHQLVLKKEADKYIAEKNYVAAAELLAESTDSFEVTVSRFLSTLDDRRDGLKRFLELQLQKLAMSESKDQIRRAVLVLWLTEVQLTELAELKLARGRTSPSRDRLVLEVTSQADIQLRNARQELEHFLAHPRFLGCLADNRDAVYRLMISHADFESQLFLAQKLKDYKTMLDIYLLQVDYKEALEVIRSQPDCELFYKYSPLLIEHIPFELVKSWMEKEKVLIPEKLLPALYRCQQNPKMVAAAFQYLKYVVRQGKATKPVHNFMISLCSMYKPEELLEYLKSFGYDKSEVPYDVEHALRICLEKEDLKRCSIFLYCVDGLYDEAVSLALTVDVELAKECARLMTDSNEETMFDFLELRQKFPLEVRRNIWLKIARHIIDEQKNIAACIELLKESNDVIKIQDVLPFFPDFATIKDFKEPLCKCLKEHSGKIRELQRQMKDATEVAQQIHTDMDKLKNKLVIIRGTDQCALCSQPILAYPFYAFNCKHLFHRDCLERQVRSAFTEEENARYEKLMEKEKIVERNLKDIDKKLYQPPKKRREYCEDLANIRAELSFIIAGECVLCGTAMIESVGKPFYTAEEYYAKLQEW